MRALVVSFCLILLSSSLFAPIRKHNPPGTLYLHSNIFIDSELVKLIHYKEFQYAAQTWWSPRINDTLIKLPKYGVDFNLVQEGLSKRYRSTKSEFKKIAYDKAFLQYYYSNESVQNRDSTFEEYLIVSQDIYDKYKEEPIADLSFEQANYYCQYRTDAVLILYAVKSSNKRQRKKYYSSVKFRLPKFNELKKYYNENYTLTKVLLDSIDNYSTASYFELIDNSDSLAMVTCNNCDSTASIVDTFWNYIYFRNVCEVEW